MNDDGDDDGDDKQTLYLTYRSNIVFVYRLCPCCLNCRKSDVRLTRLTYFLALSHPPNAVLVHTPYN